MESIKRCCNRRWGWCGTIAGNEDIEEALAFPQVPATKDLITQLLADVERALEQKDGDIPMSEEVQNYASHLEKHLDKVNVGLQISIDTLNTFGELHWVGAGLTIVAMGLNMSLKMLGNKEQYNYIMKQLIDIWKRFMKPILENEELATNKVVESMGLIIEGYLFYKNLSNSRTLKRFICASIHEKEIETFKKKLEFFLLKEIAVNTIPLRGPSHPTTSKTFATKLVGLEERKRDVMKLLKLEEEEETRVVVLQGMGGVGKSSLAEVVYKQILVSTRRRRCRIELGEKPSKDHITNLQRQMVENLTGQSLMMERDPEVIRDKLRQVLLLSETGDPVLIYIDNVLQPKDLEEFLPLDCELITLPKGSRWLITTRDESVCTRVFKRNRGFKVEMFSVKSLNEKDAQKLFFLHAFGEEDPSSEVVEEYNDGHGLIREMVSSICGNLPLALRVLGRSLFNMKVHAWRKKYNDLKDHVEFELAAEERVTNVIKASYDTLNGETQTAFLMACVCFHDFQYDVFKDVVESMLPRAITSRLFELSLLERQSSPAPDGDEDMFLSVKIHDLVRTLGYQMAVTMKCAPAKKLSCKQDFLDLNDESWNNVKWLRVPPLEDGVEAEFLEKCRELEVLIVDDTHVNGQIGNPPPHLKVIYTDGSSVPLEPHKLEELVYLAYVPDSLEEFPAALSTRRLQVLDGFSGADIPEKVIDLHKNTLRKLMCVQIAELSSYFCQEMTKLQSLIIRDFQGDSFPEEMGSLSSLETLTVSSTTIQELPQSLGHLRQLQVLILELRELKEIPSGVLGRMKELVRLQLFVESVTCMPLQDIGQLACLETLQLDLPSVNRLMELYDGESLKLEKLKFFSLRCAGLSSLEGVQLSCPSLECLSLSFGKLEVLPSKFISTGSTKQLRNLAIANCPCLQALSAETEILWALESWAVMNCPALKTIPEGLMKSVESLALVDCAWLQELPGDLDEEKAGCMKLLACDTHLLPPKFLPLPAVVAYSPDDWWAQQQLDSFVYESFFPVSAFNF